MSDKNKNKKRVSVKITKIERPQMNLLRGGDDFAGGDNSNNGEGWRCSDRNN